mgnify:CR=1 FL=1
MVNGTLVMNVKPEIPMSRALNLPDLEPVQHVRRRQRTSRIISRPLELPPKIDLIHDSAHDEAFAPEAREEPRSETARLTVIAFPIGMALLLFNIIGGENLRTTAHVLALTGLAFALAMTPLGKALFSLF